MLFPVITKNSNWEILVNIRGGGVFEGEVDTQMHTMNICKAVATTPIT